MQDVRPPAPATSSSRRELTIYDTPERRAPDDDARDRAKHVESHPFLYYLSQFVPGMRPPDAPSPDVSAAAVSGVGAALSATGAATSLWARDGVNRLFDGSQLGPRK